MNNRKLLREIRKEEREEKRRAKKLQRKLIRNTPKYAWCSAFLYYMLEKEGKINECK